MPSQLKFASAGPGKYWSDCALKGPSRTALDNEACRRLWEYSKELVGL